VASDVTFDQSCDSIFRLGIEWFDLVWKFKHHRSTIKAANLQAEFLLAYLLEYGEFMSPSYGLG
jgi:hypothetical protein